MAGMLSLDRETEGQDINRRALTIENLKIAQGVTIEATGTEDKVKALVSMLRPFGIREMARTGSVALARTSK